MSSKQAFSAPFVHPSQMVGWLVGWLVYIIAICLFHRLAFLTVYRICKKVSEGVIDRKVASLFREHISYFEESNPNGPPYPTYYVCHDGFVHINNTLSIYLSSSSQVLDCNWLI